MTYRVIVAGTWVGWIGDGREWRGAVRRASLVGALVPGRRHVRPVGHRPGLWHTSGPRSARSAPGSGPRPSAPPGEGLHPPICLTNTAAIHEDEQPRPSPRADGACCELHGVNSYPHWIDNPDM